MRIALTESQIRLANWLVEQYKAGLLSEEFTVRWELRNFKPEKGEIEDWKGKHPEITHASLIALENAGLILTTHQEVTPAKKSGVQKIGVSEVFQYGWPRHETSRTYTLLGDIFQFQSTGENIEDNVSYQYRNQTIKNRFFVSPDLIEQLMGIKSENLNLDLTRLIRYCQEINDAFKARNYHSVIFLARAILDHCPPIFRQPNFDNVSSQVEGRTFREIAGRLNLSLKKIADYHIHKQISKKEVLPVEEELDFSNDLNFLLARIIEKLHDIALPNR